MASSLRTALGALAVVVLLGSNVLAQVQPGLEQNQQTQVQLRQAQPGQPQAQPQNQFQQQRQPQQRTTLRAQQGVANETLADHEIATWLILSNEVEVRLAQLAQKGAHNSQVKQFADAMVEQHGNLINQLRQFAPSAPTLMNRQQTSGRTGEQQPIARTAEANRNNDPVRNAEPGRVDDGRGVAREDRAANGQTQTGQNENIQNDGARQGFAGRGLPIDQVCYRMAERMLNSMEKELGSKQGSEFDKCYVGSQIHEHLAMLNTLEVLKPYASAQLQQAIDQAIPATREHLAHAEKIMGQFAGGSVEQRTTGREEIATAMIVRGIVNK